MPIPADHQMVSAADAGPGAPFSSTECPSDDAEATAADIRRVAATMHANDDAAGAALTAGLALKVAKAGDTMTGPLTITTGGLTLNAGTNLAASGTASFNGAVTLEDVVSVNAPMTVQGAGSLTVASTGAATLAGPTSRSGAMTLTGDGATSSWRGEAINQAAPAVTLSVAKDFRHVTSPTGGATTYTLASTPTPPAYAELEVAVYGLPNAATLAFVREDATTIVSLAGGSATTQAVLRFRFVTDPGEWRLMGSMVSSGITLTLGTWAS